jgi:hypothetical protein
MAVRAAEAAASLAGDLSGDLSGPSYASGTPVSATFLAARSA